VASPLCASVNTSAVKTQATHLTCFLSLYCAPKAVLDNGDKLVSKTEKSLLYVVYILLGVWLTPIVPATQEAEIRRIFL
jgi:hypothetical protein